MKFMRLQNDIFGILSCFAFFASAASFWYVSKHVLFMFPSWNLAYGAPALIGMLLATTGAIRITFTKQFPVLSIVGAILNAAPVGFMAFVARLGAMH